MYPAGRHLISALAAGTFALLACAAPAQAKDCTRGDAPPGVRLPEKPGCGTAPARPDDDPALKAGRRPGFIDFGNGMEVRIGGRVRLDMDRSR